MPTSFDEDLAVFRTSLLAQRPELGRPEYADRLAHLVEEFRKYLEWDEAGRPRETRRDSRPDPEE